MAFSSCEVMVFQNGTHHFVLESDKFYEQLWVLYVIVLAIAHSWANTFLKCCVLEHKVLGCVLSVLVVKALRTLAHHTLQWVARCSLCPAFVFQVLKLLKYSKQLFLPFIFCLRRLNQSNSALLVDEVRSAWSTRRFALNAVPVLFKVGLDKFQSV